MVVNFCRDAIDRVLLDHPAISRGRTRSIASLQNAESFSKCSSLHPYKLVMQQLSDLATHTRQDVFGVAFDEGTLVGERGMEDQVIETQVDVLLDELDVVVRVG